MMNQPLELPHTPVAPNDLTDDDFDLLSPEEGLQQVSAHHEIARRRAQLECAEILRRARAL